MHQQHPVMVRVLVAETGATYRISLPLAEFTYVSTWMNGETCKGRPVGRSVGRHSLIGR
jgi:hypothetical protein